MIETIKSRQGLIVDLCRKHHVRRLAVVGSAARGYNHKGGSSDADFLVEFAEESQDGTIAEYFDFRSALETLIGLPVDLIEEAAIRNPYLRAQFEVDRELVYEA